MPTLRVPGDKSITHRALLLAGVARGTSRIQGALAAEDTTATAEALRRLGVSVSPLSGEVVEVAGGALSAAAAAIDCRNSGTTARLLAGVAAAQPFATRLTGDASLTRRPMDRVIAPLSAMGAAFDSPSGTLPMTIHGAELRATEYALPIASAQVKSAMLFAGLCGRVDVVVSEPRPSRDHTERMFRFTGLDICAEHGSVSLQGGPSPEAFELVVPGDISSAAFLIGAALLGAEETVIEDVGLNSTRTGFLQVLQRMGASVCAETTGEACGEPRGRIVATPSALSATIVEATEIPSLIDEIPLLAVLASRAEGTTTFREAGELRVKESDRLDLLAQNLRTLGVDAMVEDDDLHVTGTGRPLHGSVRTGGDHRISMAFQVLGSSRGASVSVDDPDCAAVSFPHFARALAAVSGRAAR